MVVVVAAAVLALAMGIDVSLLSLPSLSNNTKSQVSCRYLVSVKRFCSDARRLTLNAIPRLLHNS